MHNSLLKEQLFLAETWKEAKNHYLRKYLSISLSFFFKTISFKLQLLGIYRNKKLDHRAVLDVQNYKRSESKVKKQTTILTQMRIITSTLNRH